MKKLNSVKMIFALLLVLAMIFGLCACKMTSEEESTAAAAIQSQTQQAEITEAAQAGGTETITDGDKTIIYPLEIKNSQNSYPVIAWANGTGCNTESYTALLEELANGGYIVIADASTMTADGTAQIDSIDYIINQNGDSSSIFYNKVDTESIGVCGHSQGGRSCINAAQADARIRCVVSIAGASSAEEASGLTAPSLFLTGTNDLVVVSSRWCKPSYDAVAGRAAYASLDGGIHTTCMVSPKKVSDYALSWFDAYLKGDSDAKAVFEDDGKLAHDYDWKDFENKN